MIVPKYCSPAGCAARGTLKAHETLFTDGWLYHPRGKGQARIWSERLELLLFSSTWDCFGLVEFAMRLRNNFPSLAYNVDHKRRIWLIKIFSTFLMIKTIYVRCVVFYLMYPVHRKIMLLPFVHQKTKISNERMRCLSFPMLHLPAIFFLTSKIFPHFHRRIRDTNMKENETFFLCYLPSFIHNDTSCMSQPTMKSGAGGLVGDSPSRRKKMFTKLSLKVMLYLRFARMSWQKEPMRHIFWLINWKLLYAAC